MKIHPKFAGQAASPGSVTVMSTCASIVFLLICGLMSACGRILPGGNGTRPIEARLFSVDELSQDFQQFRTIMERKTAGLYTDRARLSAMLDEMATTLTEPRTEAEFYRLLAPAVAELRCGHSFLSVSRVAEARLREEALFFPLEIRIFGRDLMVIGGSAWNGRQTRFANRRHQRHGFRRHRRQDLQNHEHRRSGLRKAAIRRRTMVCFHVL